MSMFCSVPEAVFPEWIRTPSFSPRPVRFTADAIAMLHTLQSHLRVIPNAAEYMALITQLLPLDIRSLRQGRGSATGDDVLFRAQIDALDVEFVTLEDAIEVVHFCVSPLSPEAAVEEESEL